MREIRRTVIALLINLTILYNVERLGFAQSSTVDIAGFVYILEITAVALTIIIPVLWNTPLYTPLLIWGSIYLVGKILYLHDRPFLGGIHTYLTITEITLLLSSVLLARNLARALQSFKEAVESVTLADVRRRVRSLREAQDDIQTELIRSRRHEHPLSVVVVEVDAEVMQAELPQTIYEVQKAMVERYITLRLAHTVSQQLRRTDITLEYDQQGRFIILCPETNAEGASAVVERIQHISEQALGIPIAAGVASFPGEALTFEDLVRQAEERMRVVPLQGSVAQTTVKSREPVPS